MASILNGQGGALVVALALSACVEAKPEPQLLPDGTPNCNWQRYSSFSGPMGQAYNRAYREACLVGTAESEARASGGTVTRCYPTPEGGSMCVTD